MNYSDLPTLKRGVASRATATCVVHVAVDSVDNGLAIGGLRVTPNASAEEAVELAEAMTQKLGLFGVRAGGAKVLVEPGAGRTFAEMRADIAESVRPFLAAGLLLGEDVGVTSDEVRELYLANGIDPVENTLRIVRARGIEVETPALALEQMLTVDFSGQLAGRGVVMVLSAAMRGQLRDGETVTVSVQGVGSVGGTTARVLSQTPGFLVVGVCDAKTYVHDPEGMQQEWLDQNIDAHGNLTVQTLSGTAVVGRPQEWMKDRAQVLVAAAVRDSITMQNVNDVPEDVVCVVEAANLAVTPAAASALADRGVLVIPGSLASAFTSVCFGLLATGEANLDTVESIYKQRVESILAQAH